MGRVKEALLSYVGPNQIARVVDDEYRLRWIARSDQWDEYLTALSAIHASTLRDLVFRSVLNMDARAFEQATLIGSDRELDTLCQEMAQCSALEWMERLETQNEETGTESNTGTIG